MSTKKIKIKASKIVKDIFSNNLLTEMNMILEPLSDISKSHFKNLIVDEFRASATQETIKVSPRTNIKTKFRVKKFLYLNLPWDFIESIENAMLDIEEENLNFESEELFLFELVKGFEKKIFTKQK